MKSKARLFVVTLTCAGLLLLSGCGEIYRYMKSGEAGWALKKELRDKRSKEVDMTRLVKFKWDEFFAFGPYTPTTYVCKRLALSDEQCQKKIKAESSDDGEMLLVFRQDGKVAYS